MKTMRPILKLEVDEALKKGAWDLGNKALYDLCSKNPRHKTDQEIIAKVWIIGRTYSAAIERRKKKNLNSPGDLFYEREVAPKIRSSAIDDWLKQLKTKPTSENAVATHFKLMTLFHGISGLEKRSLASKYLHFHFRNIFFIYDSRSMAAIRKVTPNSEKKMSPLSKEVDANYAKFYRRCLWLQKDLKERFGRKLSPREIDKILLHIKN